MPDFLSRPRLPLALVAAAVVLGGYLRCTGLATTELSADEGASWAAAAAPTLGQVLRLQARLNPGKLGLHDIALHLWMRIFGESLVALRSLSAVIGTAAILLVFVVVREVLALAPPSAAEAEDASSDQSTASDASLIAGLAALVFAVNLVTIKYAREARMYPLALLLVMAQVGFFTRSLRHGTTASRVGLALTTALAIAATFTTALVLVPEGLYLTLRLAMAPAANYRRVVTVGLGLAAGLIMLAPFLLIAIHLGGGAPKAQAVAWITRPSPVAPLSLFNKATGTYAFPLLAILAASGTARSWTRWRPALTFLLLWMLAPPIALTLFSYAVEPAFVERYLVMCFVPFFALVGMGLFELQPAKFRPGALALVVALGLAHVAAWSRKPHGTHYAEAAAAAAAATAPAATGAIGVVPPYATNVVRYYLRDASPARLVEAATAQPPPAVVIVGDTADPAVVIPLFRAFPRALAHFEGVVVRGPQ